jgi:hypothetical protein
VPAVMKEQHVTVLALIDSSGHGVLKQANECWTKREVRGFIHVHITADLDVLCCGQGQRVVVLAVDQYAEVLLREAIPASHTISWSGGTQCTPPLLPDCLPYLFIKSAFMLITSLTQP